MTKTFCDTCGKEIKAADIEHSGVNIFVGVQKDGDSRDVFDGHLCTTHRNEFLDFLFSKIDKKGKKK